MKVFITFVLLWVFTNASSQQKEIDSLKQVLPNQERLEQVGILNKLSWHYKNFDVDSAKLFSNQALAIGLEIDSKDAISQSYNSLASIYQAVGQFDSAIHYHNQSFTTKEELGDTLGMAASYNNLGIAYDEKGDYAVSLQNYFKALAFYEEKSDDPYDVAMVLGNIGIVYKKQKEYDEVLEYYGRALTIYEEVDSEFGQMVTKGNMSSVMLLTGDYQLAISYATDAMKWYGDQGYTRYVPYMQHNLAIAYDSLKQYDKAETLFNQSVQGHIETDNKYELASSLIGLAGIQRKKRSFKIGSDNALKGLNLAQEIGAKEFVSRAEFELAQNLAMLGNYKGAFDHLLAYGSMKDSLFEEDKTKQIFDLKTKYDTERKEQQILLQNAQLSEQETQLQLNRILLIASIVTMILIVSLALLNRNRLSKKQQIELQQERLNSQEASLKAALSSQEKERARYARDLHDGFGQMISILNMNIKNLEGNPKPNERQTVFDESEKVINDMYDELKSICFDLMPQTLVKNGLTAALDEFAGRINKSGKVFVETNYFGLEDRLDEVKEISLYRISQEWINNILKYSSAEKITLQVIKDDDEINLILEDDGQGFDKNLLMKGSGNGWKNIHTRAKLVKGEVELDTNPATKGSTLVVKIDLTNKTVNNVQNTVETV